MHLKRFSQRLVLASALGLLMASVFCNLAAAKDVQVPVYVDGKLAHWKNQAIVRDGKTYAPLRAAAEAIGAHVTWHPESQMAVVCRGDQCVPIPKSKGIIVNGRLYIPLRLMAEALQCKVRWDAQKKAVMIETGSGLPSSGG